MFVGEIQHRRQPIVIFTLERTASELRFRARQHPLWKRPQIDEGSKVVEQALGQSSSKKRLTQAIETSLLQRPEGGDEIAAVDRRNEKRRVCVVGVGVQSSHQVAAVPT